MPTPVVPERPEDHQAGSRPPEVLLAIPARGGSKRLPRKNVRPLAGKPMLAWTVEAARASELAPDVWVCTEDDEIARVAEAAGARVHRIPAEMAGDEVSSTVPCLDLHARLRAEGAPGGGDDGLLMNLQPTSPLRHAGDLRRAVARLLETRADFLVSVTSVDPHYFHWAMTNEGGGDTAWRMFFGDRFLVERPRLPPIHRPNGAIKLGRVRALRALGHFFGPSLAVLDMPEERSIHVATDFDFACAESLAGRRSDPCRD